VSENTHANILLKNLEPSLESIECIHHASEVLSKHHSWYGVSINADHLSMYFTMYEI